MEDHLSTSHLVLSYEDTLKVIIQIEGYDSTRVKMLEADISSLVRERSRSLFGVQAPKVKDDRCKGCGE